MSENENSAARHIRRLLGHALSYGGIGGAGGAAWLGAALAFDFFHRPVVVFGVAVPIGCIVVSVQRWRDRGLGGHIRFAQAAGAGLATGLVFAAVAAAYLFLHAAVIQPDLIETFARVQADALRAQGQAEDAIAAADATLRAGYSPGFLALAIFRTLLPVVLIISLVAAAFVRKSVK